jgi:Rab-like protein 5
MEKKLKILILGPNGAGKSCLSNYLAEKSEPIDKNYKPTVGLRILEFEKTVCHSRAPAGESWLIQLWDVSGDQRYDNCWTAVKHETNGVLILHNGDIKLNEEEFLGWIKAFPHKMNIAPNYCLGFAHHPSGKMDHIEQKSFMKFGLHIYHSLVEDGINTIMPPFDKFINVLVDKYYNDMEESEQAQ